ncbi:hypothetical protein H9P43_006914 [Blastocladiella emersonii ATCC 22665]|nr:hypothetical protein H9P43_006914 [Blastocladiella emersonii ATCC 22665]
MKQKKGKSSKTKRKAARSPSVGAARDDPSPPPASESPMPSAAASVPLAPPTQTSATLALDNETDPYLPYGKSFSRDLFLYHNPRESKHLGALVFQCGDLRDVAHTVGEARRKYGTANLDFVLSDTHFEVLARNLLVLRAVAQTKITDRAAVSALTRHVGQLTYSLYLDPTTRAFWAEQMRACLAANWTTPDAQVRVLDDATRRGVRACWESWLAVSWSPAKFDQTRTAFYNTAVRPTEVPSHMSHTKVAVHRTMQRLRFENMTKMEKFDEPDSLERDVTALATTGHFFLDYGAVSWSPAKFDQARTAFYDTARSRKVEDTTSHTEVAARNTMQRLRSENMTKLKRFGAPINLELELRSIATEGNFFLDCSGASNPTALVVNPTMLVAAYRYAGCEPGLVRFSARFGLTPLDVFRLDPFEDLHMCMERELAQWVNTLVDVFGFDAAAVPLTGSYPPVATWSELPHPPRAQFRCCLAVVSGHPTSVMEQLVAMQTEGQDSFMEIETDRVIPLWFNVVQTGSIIDTCGLLSVLVHASPLLATNREPDRSLIFAATENLTLVAKNRREFLRRTTGLPFQALPTLLGVNFRLTWAGGDALPFAPWPAMPELWDALRESGVLAPHLAELQAQAALYGFPIDLGGRKQGVETDVYRVEGVFNMAVLDAVRAAAPLSFLILEIDQGGIAHQFRSFATKPADNGKQLRVATYVPRYVVSGAAGDGGELRARIRFVCGLQQSLPATVKSVPLTEVVTDTVPVNSRAAVYAGIVYFPNVTRYHWPRSNVPSVLSPVRDLTVVHAAEHAGEIHLTLALPRAYLDGSLKGCDFEERRRGLGAVMIEYGRGSGKKMQAMQLPCGPAHLKVIKTLTVHPHNRVMLVLQRYLAPVSPALGIYPLAPSLPDLYTPGVFGVTSAQFSAVDTLQRIGSVENSQEIIALSRRSPPNVHAALKMSIIQISVFGALVEQFWKGTRVVELITMETGKRAAVFLLHQLSANPPANLFRGYTPVLDCSYILHPDHCGPSANQADAALLPQIVAKMSPGRKDAFQIRQPRTCMVAGRKDAFQIRQPRTCMVAIFEYLGVAKKSAPVTDVPNDCGIDPVFFARIKPKLTRCSILQLYPTQDRDQSLYPDLDLPEALQAPATAGSRVQRAAASARMSGRGGNVDSRIQELN